MVLRVGSGSVSMGQGQGGGQEQGDHAVTGANGGTGQFRAHAPPRHVLALLLFLLFLLFLVFLVFLVFLARILYKTRGWA